MLPRPPPDQSTANQASILATHCGGFIEQRRGAGLRRLPALGAHAGSAMLGRCHLLPWFFFRGGIYHSANAKKLRCCKRSSAAFARLPGACSVRHQRFHANCVATRRPTAARCSIVPPLPVKSRESGAAAQSEQACAQQAAACPCARAAHGSNIGFPWQENFRLQRAVEGTAPRSKSRPTLGHQLEPAADQLPIAGGLPR